MQEYNLKQVRKTVYSLISRSKTMYSLEDNSVSCILYFLFSTLVERIDLLLEFVETLMSLSVKYTATIQIIYLNSPFNVPSGLIL